MFHKARKFTNIDPNIRSGIIPLCKGRKIKQNIVKPKIISLTDITYKSKTNTKRIRKKKKRRRLFSTKKKYIKKCEGRNVFGSKKDRHLQQIKQWNKKHLNSSWWKQYRKTVRAQKHIHHNKSSFAERIKCKDRQHDQIKKSLFLSEMDSIKLIEEKEERYQAILTDQDLVNAVCKVPITWNKGKVQKFGLYPLTIVLTCLALLCVINAHLIPFIIRIIFGGFLTETIATHLGELIPSATTLHNWKHYILPNINAANLVYDFKQMLNDENCYKILKLDGSSVKSVGFEPFLIKCKKQINKSIVDDDISDIDLDICLSGDDQEETESDVNVAENDKLENDNDDRDSEDTEIDRMTEFVSISLASDASINHIRNIILEFDQPLKNDYIKRIVTPNPQFKSTSIVFGISKIQSKSAVDIAKVWTAKSNKCNTISKQMFNEELIIEEHIDATMKDRAKNEGKAVDIILGKRLNGFLDGDCSMHILNTIGDVVYNYSKLIWSSKSSKYKKDPLYIADKLIAWAAGTEYEGTRYGDAIPIQTCCAENNIINVFARQLKRFPHSRKFHIMLCQQEVLIGINILSYYQLKTQKLPANISAEIGEYNNNDEYLIHMVYYQLWGNILYQLQCHSCNVAASLYNSLVSLLFLYRYILWAQTNAMKLFSLCLGLISFTGSDMWNACTQYNKIIRYCNGSSRLNIAKNKSIIFTNVNQPYLKLKHKMKGKGRIYFESRVRKRKNSNYYCLAKRGMLFAVKYCIENKLKIYDENGDMFFMNTMDLNIAWNVFVSKLHLGKYERAPFQDDKLLGLLRLIDDKRNASMRVFTKAINMFSGSLDRVAAKLCDIFEKHSIDYKFVCKNKEELLKNDASQCDVESLVCSTKMMKKIHRKSNIDTVGNLVEFKRNETFNKCTNDKAKLDFNENYLQQLRENISQRKYYKNQKIKIATQNKINWHQNQKQGQQITAKKSKNNIKYKDFQLYPSIFTLQCKISSIQNVTAKKEFLRNQLRYIRDVKTCCYSKNKQKNIRKTIRGFSSDNSCSKLLKRLKSARLQLGLDKQTQMCSKCRNNNKKCSGGCTYVNYKSYVRPLPTLL
eukprot:107005_1